jgi:hypothetical protein
VDGKSMYDQEFSPYQGTYSSNTVRHLAYVLLQFISFTSFIEKWSHVKFKQSIT